MPIRPEPSAVVGWGSITPLGGDPDSTWQAFREGQSGIQSLKDDWSLDLPVRIGGRVPPSALEGLSSLLRRRSDRCAQLALVAARQAWTMASSSTDGIHPSRVAVVLGTGIGGLSTMHEQHLQLTEGGPDRVNPLTVPMLIPDAPAGQVAIDLGIQVVHTRRFQPALQAPRH